jgi:hypothetical protein
VTKLAYLAALAILLIEPLNAMAQTMDQPSGIPINATKAHLDGQQTIRYVNTFNQMITTCQQEPDGSRGQADCNSFFVDFNTHIRELFSNHTSLINHLLGLVP